jgi:hypothetical protein
VTSNETAIVVVVVAGTVETTLFASNGAKACGAIATDVGVTAALVVGAVVAVVVEEDGGGDVVVVDVVVVVVEVVVVAAAAMVNCTIATAVAVPTVAVMVTLDDPPDIGVPVIAPVAEFNTRPAGRAPLVTEYEMPAPTVEPLKSEGVANAVSATMSTLIARGTNTEVAAAIPAPPLFTARSSNT